MERPPYEQLLEEIEATSYVAVGRKYGVSDNAVRKWVRFYERQMEREVAEAEASCRPGLIASGERLRVRGMEMGTPAMDPEIREGLQRSWKALMTVGVLAIVIGCIAILVPAVASVGTAIFIGWILVIAGAFLVAGAFMAHSIGSVILRLIWALLTVVVGLWLIVEPHNGTLTLTLVLGIYFLFMGLTRIAVAFAARGQEGAGLVGLSGVAGLLIGILVLAKFPSSADWAIGLLVGIDLIFAGWTLTSVALVGRRDSVMCPPQRPCAASGRSGSQPRGT